ncbi:uncharacterized protein [Antedon mediterranea]|uniref:uncharacterized protein n=1 Tax=Antedon mediterranea TaxID=105859 RepID=UPI003AF7B8AB
MSPRCKNEQTPMETKRMLSPVTTTCHTDRTSDERSVSPSSSGHRSPPTKSEASFGGSNSRDAVSRFYFGPLHRRPTQIPSKPLDLSNITRLGTSAVSSTTPFKIYPYSHLSSAPAVPTYNFSHLDHALTHPPSAASYPSSYPPTVYPYGLSEAPLSYNSLRLSALLVSRKRSRQPSTSGDGNPPSVASDDEGESRQDKQNSAKKFKGIPDEKKDELYWERRRKNNDAAKRSRDSRRAKEEEIAIRAMCLEQENWKLKTEVCCLKTEIARLHSVYNHY